VDFVCFVHGQSKIMIDGPKNNLKFLQLVAPPSSTFDSFFTPVIDLFFSVISAANRKPTDIDESPKESHSLSRFSSPSYF
jgi:hypothetical protein